ncbi:hypothetical protein [Streptomyces sp. NBC_01794]|nr:hypothetical protein OIE54_37660 [Streptomyces sp. NBC_01794]
MAVGANDSARYALSNRLMPYGRDGEPAASAKSLIAKWSMAI